MNLDELLLRERLPSSYRRIVTEIHAPVARQLLAAAQGRGAPLLVGLCGAQGSGKSTMTLMLRELLQTQGARVAALSLDDLYLRRAERLELSRNVHPLLATRGVPGTHDVALGLRTFAALRGNGTVRLPSFDKASDDRREAVHWPSVAAPVDIILFEGWCMAARPQSPTALRSPINALEREYDADGRWRGYVNDALAGPYRALFEPLDVLILLQAPSFDVVFRWRLEQERKLRERVQQEGGSGQRIMSEAEVATFIAHYERITRHILEEMPARADVLIELDEQRVPLLRRC